MYFIQCKEHNSFLVFDGLGTQGDFQKTNKSLVVAENLAKSKQLVAKLQEIAPENYKFQAITKSTFQKNIKVARKSLEVKKQITGTFRKKLLLLLESLSKTAVIKRVNSSTYCPVLPVKDNIKSKISQFVAEEKESEININQELEFTSVEDSPQPTISTHIIPVLPSLQEDLVRNMDSTLANLSELLSSSLETTQNYVKDMKNIEHEIIDVLHFIEFEPTDSVDTKEVYDRLHRLRKKRRELKDKLYLSQLLLARFHSISPESLMEDIEKVKKLEKRAYALRAPDCHPKLWQ